MKTLLATTAIAASLAFAGAASAQMYRPMPAAQPTAPTWMMDDGSSSDHPIHNPGDVSGDALNSQYRDGLTVPPGSGFPAYPGQR